MRDAESVKLRVTILLVGLAAIAVAAGFMETPRAYALPEYTIRTGEPCATCHVSPGGGGRLTMRGLLWSARGRPDQVPQLANVLIAPDITTGPELYQFACASCHGRDGEGLFGGPVANTPLSPAKIEAATLRGRVRSGMPAFAGQFTPEQLQTLVDYVYALSGGQVEPPPLSFPLPAVSYACNPIYLPLVFGRPRGN